VLLGKGLVRFCIGVATTSSVGEIPDIKGARCVSVPLRAALFSPEAERNLRRNHGGGEWVFAGVNGDR